MRKRAIEHTSQVHDRETTGTPAVYDTYRAYRFKPYISEIESADRLYRMVQDDFNERFQTTYKICCLEAWFAIHKVTRKVVVIPRRCRWRWCPVCAHAKTRAVTENVTAWIQKEPEVRLLTVTVKHSDNSLSSLMQHLTDAWRRLRRFKDFKKNVTGGIWFYQLKRSNGNTQWHPHIHCLISGSYFDKFDLRDLWNRATGDSYIIDIRAIHDREKAAAYVARYVARPADISTLPDEELLEMYSAIKGKRLSGSFGTARGIKLREVPMINHDDYEKIGTWLFVTTAMESLPDLQAVYKAFMTDTAVSADIDIKQYIEFLNLPPPPNYFVETAEQIQGALW